MAGKLLPFLNQVLQWGQKHLFLRRYQRSRFQGHNFLFERICKMYQISEILPKLLNEFIIIVNSATFVSFEHSSKVLVKKSQFSLHFDFGKSHRSFLVLNFWFSNFNLFWVGNSWKIRFWDGLLDLGRLVGILIWLSFLKWKWWLFLCLFEIVSQIRVS